MSGRQTACPLHVRAEQLSALYDDTLDAAAAASLRQHLTMCGNCQRRLDDYARISAALQAQHVPTPDVRLQQSILEARERAKPTALRLEATREAGRAVAVAAVILIVSGFAAVLLNHVTPHRVATMTTPTATVNAPTTTTTTTVPAIWSEILPTRHSLGFAVSAARPERLVGCGVPGDGSDAWPYPALAISDDGGQTWRESAIQDIGSVTTCIVVVDQLRPDTIIVSDGSLSRFAVTTDAGRTWRALALPPNKRMDYPGTLVDGQLIGRFHSVINPSRLMLGALSIAGSFHILDAQLPYQDSAVDNTPIAFAVDPTNPLHLYALIPGKSDPAQPTSDVQLYATSDGGGNWQLYHTFPYGRLINLWAPTPGVLYLWVADPMKSPNGNPLQESVDGGVTWRAITPASYRLGGAWIGPDGRIVVITGTGTDAAPTLAELTPTTGALKPIGQLPNALLSGFTGTVTGGAHPVFVVAGFSGAYVTPLP